VTSEPIEPPPGAPGDGAAAWAWDGPEPVEPTDAELFGLGPDPYAGPPDGADAWLADLSGPEFEIVAARWAAENGAAGIDAVAAGFARDVPGDLAVGFAAGGALDVMAPDEVLAGFAGDAVDAGLSRLSDDELVGLLCAARRLSSWQAAIEIRAVAELDARRQPQAERPGSSRVSEHVSAELAAALTLTGRSADVLLGYARELNRLPTVLAALAAGRIDRARAEVFARELAALSDLKAQAIAMALIDDAGKMTTGQLRGQLRAMVLWLDAEALRRRAERARAGARVETWPEGSGNACISGRELPPAEVIAADARITAIAKALKAAGAVGSLDRLRAAVLTALLTGRDPWTLLPATDHERPADPQPGAGLTGSVHLTLPLATWLGTSDVPGEAAGYGPLDAFTSRDLAAKMAADRSTRWCLTLTDPDGRAVGHACLRAPPARGSPGTGPGPGPVSWPRLTIHWLERGHCTHPRQTPAYRPGPLLRHLIMIRHRSCAAPGCRRPAQHCDLDHTIPFDQGGRTCECNLAPVCRRHHQVKQAPGWHLDQPEPGHLTWTTPSGRRYTVRPDTGAVLCASQVRLTARRPAASRESAFWWAPTVATKPGQGGGRSAGRSGWPAAS
jgi:hypothetical protein